MFELRTMMWLIEKPHFNTNLQHDILPGSPSKKISNQDFFGLLSTLYFLPSGLLLQVFLFLNPLDQLLNPFSNNPLPTQVVLSKPREKDLFKTLPPSWLLTGLAWPRLNCDLSTASYHCLSYTAASHTVFCIEQQYWFPLELGLVADCGRCAGCNQRSGAFLFIQTGLNTLFYK